jgi:hypothetical protein
MVKKKLMSTKIKTDGAHRKSRLVASCVAHAGGVEDLKNHHVWAKRCLINENRFTFAPSSLTLHEALI